MESTINFEQFRSSRNDDDHHSELGGNSSKMTNKKTTSSSHDYKNNNSHEGQSRKRKHPSASMEAAMDADANADAGVAGGSTTNTSTMTTSTSTSRRSIRPMEETTAHKMVAGQAIMDMSSAVKELIDNALDAKAKTITIKLVSYASSQTNSQSKSRSTKNTTNNNMPGIDLIEVSDDGTGVPKEDRPYLAMKHATSKLTSFDQLYGGGEALLQEATTTTPFTTLGFRGEALFSLATLSEQLIITTKRQGESVGEQLMFDQTGTLIEDSTIQVGACKVGTTVSVHKLFHPLPVRRLDFIKRIKTQRAQLFKLLQGYAILCRDVQFHVSDIVMSSPNTNDNSSGSEPSHETRRQILKKEVRLVTKSNSPTLEHTISSVLGHAFLQDMVRIPTIQRPCRLDDSGSKMGEETNDPHDDSDSALVWKLEGLVSRAPMPTTATSSSKMKQSQQQARELQFLSVNHRPVDLNNSLSKVITNVWKSLFTGTVYSKNNKRPAAILSLTLPSHLVDINVSPNKREVLLSPEQDICDAVQTTLMELWSSQINGIFPTNEVLHMSQGGGSRTITKTATTTTDASNSKSNQTARTKQTPKPTIDLTQFLAPKEEKPADLVVPPKENDGGGGAATTKAVLPERETSETTVAKDNDDDDNDDDDVVDHVASSSSNRMATATKATGTTTASSSTTTISETERIHQLQLSQNQKTTVKTVPVEDIIGKRTKNENHQLSSHQNTRLSPSTGTHHSQPLSFQRSPPPRPQLSLSQAMAQHALLSSSPETARLMLRGATSPMRHSSGMMMSPSSEPPRSGRPRRRGTLALGYLPNDSNDNHDPLALLNSSRMMMDHVIAAAAASATSTPNRQRTMERRNAYVEPRATNHHNHSSISGGGGGATLLFREKNLDELGITPQPPSSASLNCTSSSSNSNDNNHQQAQLQPSSTHEAGMKRSYETDEEEEQPSTHTHDYQQQQQEELCHKTKKKKKRQTKSSKPTSGDGLAFLQSFAFDGTSNSNNHPLEDVKPKCGGSSSASASEDDDDDEDDHSSSSLSPFEIVQTNKTNSKDDQDSNKNSNSIIETPHVNKHATSTSTKHSARRSTTTTTNNKDNEVSIKNNPRKVTPQSVLSDNDNDDDDEDESSILHKSTSTTSPPAETKREEEVPVVWNAFSGMNSILRQYETQRRMARTIQEEYIRRQQQTQQQEQTDQNKKIDSIMEDGSSTNKEKEEDTIGTVPDKSIATKTLSTFAAPVSLSKEEFVQMQIVGQFNLGFILGVSPKNRDLWILDQHACDEKYNFEQYVKHSVIHEQTLLKPLPLELSASEENCVLDHIDVFRRNGFRFKYDSNQPPRHRLSLVALPHSGSGGGGRKAVQFGSEDVGALCAILGADGAYSSSSYTSGGGTGTDGSGMFGNNAVRRYAGGTGHDLSLLSSTSSQSSNLGQHQSATQNEQNESNNNSNDSQTLKTQTVGIQGSNLARLPKAIAMFASRACRNSIMIGHPLSQKQMTQVVTKMCLVDQPWDCPHGRPTIRHVTQLQSSLYQDEMEEHDYRTKFHLPSLRHNAMDSDNGGDDDDDDDHEDSDSEQTEPQKDKNDDNAEVSKEQEVQV